MTPSHRLVLQLVALGTLVSGLQAGVYLLRGGEQGVLPRTLRAFKARLAEGPDVVFLGDSVIRWVFPDDADKRSVSERLDDLVPESVASLDHPSYHMEVYEALARFIARQERKPRWVVVPINLRSFSAGWRYRPENQFVKERLLLSHDSLLLRLFFNPLAVFKAIELIPITTAEYENAPVMDGDTLRGTVRDFMGSASRQKTDENVRDQLISRYMYRLSPTDPHVGAMRQTVRVLEAAGIRPIFYLTPVDVESGEKFLGPRFREALDRNRQVILQALADEGARPTDLLFALGSEHFMWVLYPDEHLREAGRQFVAENIAARIR